MKYRKVNKKKNTIVSVKDWSNEIVIQDMNTKEILGQKAFSNHVVAIMLAKQL